MSTHNEVAHAWANQTGKNRKGFNMYYEGMTIFSYGSHFPIARLVDTPAGRVVLMTTESYSISTSKHITYTRRACHHMRTFNVPYVATSGGMVDNAKSYLSRIIELLEKAKRARVYGPSLMRQATDLIAEAQDFIRAFEVPGFETMTWDPETMVAGAREVARLQEQRMAEARRLQDLAAKKRYREEVWPRIKAWLSGGDADPPENRFYAPLRTDRPLPRIEGDRVVTSWGASVPLAAARRLYWVAVQCRRTKKTYAPQDTLRVGDFTLRHIKKNGDIVVGCHDIPFWFMRYAACRAGIPATAPSAIAA